ncbi:TonB-dependent siderophore receptor [Pseudomonas sp. LRF_L74]|uniref:TonB-dependent siderophore receptor n=1 Tax=Pseudomonas sp. LRF_L74 TaxID=3369422 RepID=UPI003F63A68B
MPFLRPSLSLTLLLALSTLAMPARSEDRLAAALSTEHAFALPAQQLADSLRSLSQASGVNMVYVDEGLLRRPAPALQGRMTLAQALARLLDGSGLSYRQGAANTLAVEPAQPAPQAELTPLNIDARRNASYQPGPAAQVSRGRENWLHTPQAIGQVAPQILRDQAPRNLDDALRNISGIVQGNTLGSTQDTLMKRGFGDNRDGSILRDGLPVVQGRNFNATSERVEALKGPAGLLYGIQEPGGVINVVSKTAQREPYHALSSRVSSYGHGKNGSGGTLDSTEALGDSDFAYRLILDQQDEDYWRNYGVHREELVAPSLAWFGEDTEVQLAYEYREFLTPFDRGTAIDPRTNRPLAIPYQRRLDEPFNDMRGRSELARLSINRQLSADWTLRAAYSYNRETYDAYQVRVTGVNTATGTLSRSMDGTLDSLSRNSIGLLELAGEHRLFGLDHELLLGISDEHRLYYRADLLRQASSSTFSYLNPVYGQEPVPTQVSADSSDQLDRLRSMALYLRDSIHLNEDWLLMLGSRFLTYDQYAGRGRPFHANTDIDGQAWVPSAGLVYSFAPGWSWYVSYSQSFKPNSSIAPLNASSAQIIDASILPERARAWESGLKFEQDDGLTASLALFDIRKRNVLVSELVDNQSISRNAGEVGSRGLELDFSGELARHWSLVGAYAYTRARVLSDPTLQGNRLLNVPLHSGSLYLTYANGPLLGGDDLRLGAGARYVGARAGDPANSFDLPAYTVADAFASYETGLGEHRLRIQLNANNLFNRHYYTSSVSRYFVSMGDPRQLVLSTTLEF